jgi:FkbH-like protein
MYETEANQKRESQDQLPTEVIVRLAEANRTVLDRTVLPWSEHCTECVWPTCYSSCDLYVARGDGKCRRFVDGMVRVDCPEAMNSYILKITFKRWAKLWAPGNICLRPAEQARRIEHRDYHISRVLYQLPVPEPIKKVITKKRYGLKKKLAYHASAGELEPTSFMLECYNPGTHSVRLSLNIVPAAEKLAIPFQELLEMVPGFHRVRVPFERIAGAINLAESFNVELIPNEDINEITLLFGIMDFVREGHLQDADSEAPFASIVQTVKCIVWDLDNTLWDGILLEDGPSGLALKNGLREIIQELDRRGIMQSVASKNNHDEALAMLGRVGLDDMFLFPQISWLPKSESIREIARRLNIGLDTVLFVDDSEFELRQVCSALPDVRTINAERYMELVNLDECKVVTTSESRNRRMMYRIETQRQDVAASFADDYLAFLRHCNICVAVRPMSEDNIDRVHELTQRTNQMNFSGNQYDRNVLREILSKDYLDTYVLEVDDRFGSYGVVGFCIVDRRTPLMTDLMFSCRIQSKRVEHAFVGYLIRQYISQTGMDFQANYRKTARNAPSGRVFADLGMQEVSNKDGISRLVFHMAQPVPDDGLVGITVHEVSPIV